MSFFPHSRIRFLTQAALIATLYLLLTYLSYAIGLDKGAIQLRLAEALCVLVCFTAAAVPGMTVGCFLANLLTGCMLPDVICGTLATLLGTLFGWVIAQHLIQNHHRTAQNSNKGGAEGRPINQKNRGRLSFARVFLVTLPTVLANAAIIPLLLMWVYGLQYAYGLLLLGVTLGELLSASVLGGGLYRLLAPHAASLFAEKKPPYRF